MAVLPAEPVMPTTVVVGEPTTGQPRAVGEGDHRVVDLDERALLDGARTAVVDDGQRRAAVERVGDEVVPVAHRAQREEAAAALEDAGVDGERRRARRLVAVDDTPARLADVGRGQLHAASISSRATTRSSNGTVTPPAVCPVS